jgi:hypothetical protein
MPCDLLEVDLTVIGWNSPICVVAVAFHNNTKTDMTLLALIRVYPPCGHLEQRKECATSL